MKFPTIHYNIEETKITIGDLTIWFCQAKEMIAFKIGGVIFILKEHPSFMGWRSGYDWRKTIEYIKKNPSPTIIINTPEEFVNKFEELTKGA